MKVLTALFFVMASIAASAEPEYFVYFGTFTEKASKGIYAARFDPATGKVTMLGTVAETPNPSFLALSPDRRFLYAVNARDSGAVKGNTVSAYRIDAHTAQLTFLNKVSSRGDGPTHLSTASSGPDLGGRMLIAVNFRSGSVAAFPVAKDGSLGESTSFDQHHGAGMVKDRQEGPHAHSVVFSPDNRFALVADLGLDKVFSYRVDPAKATFTANDPPFAGVAAGAGPRHIAFHPNGRLVYVNNEINSTVTVFAYDQAKGSLRELQTVSTLPADFKGSNSTAEIQVDAAGHFLYVSNRGHDSIAVFAIDAAKGTLKTVEHVSTQGKSPRNFSLDPTGRYLFAANENSESVVLFRVDAKTGRLTPAGQKLEISSPVCIIFLKAE